MVEINATILIPDISGFTEFMTSTELTHGSRAVNILIDTILEAIDETYEVSEIEGDAVLLIRQGPPPSKKEILTTCLKIFNTFHSRRKWMQQHMVCPCKACKQIARLTLKFVAHHGALAEIKVGRFVKHSGPEMIIAHRLLKNKIENNEYLLFTEQLINQTSDASETDRMLWESAMEEYSSLGKVRFRYASLNEIRENVPDPPPLENTYHSDDAQNFHITIDAPCLDVYMTLMNIPSRHEWIPGLKQVEQAMPDVFIGSTHCCSFDDYEAIVSPFKVEITDESILYAETCRIDSLNCFLIHEFQMKKVANNKCEFSVRIINAGETPILEEIATRLSERCMEMARGLKRYCEEKRGC